MCFSMQTLLLCESEGEEAFDMSILHVSVLILRIPLVQDFFQDRGGNDGDTILPHSPPQIAVKPHIPENMKAHHA